MLATIYKLADGRRVRLRRDDHPDLRGWSADVYTEEGRYLATLWSAGTVRDIRGEVAQWARDFPL
jgi:hypothetical protein